MSNRTKKKKNWLCMCEGRKLKEEKVCGCMDESGHTSSLFSKFFSSIVTVSMLAFPILRN